MEKMEKPLGNSPFSPFYAIGPPLCRPEKSLTTLLKNFSYNLYVLNNPPPGLTSPFRFISRLPHYTYLTFSHVSNIMTHSTSSNPRSLQFPSQGTNYKRGTLDSRIVGEDKKKKAETGKNQEGKYKDHRNISYQLGTLATVYQWKLFALRNQHGKYSKTPIYRGL